MLRTGAVSAVTAIGVVAGTAASAHATPHPTPTATVGPAAAARAGHVSGALGSDSGGYFLDSHGRAVVNVVNHAAAERVRAAGLTPKTVAYSFSTLTRTRSALDRFAGIPNTAWGIDPARDKVVVTVSTAAPKAAAARLTAAARGYGNRVEIRRSTGRFESYIAGGDAIENGSVRCSNGFNVTNGGQLYLLTAGHCTNEGGTWSPVGGGVAASDFPGADSGLIVNNSGSGPSVINDGTTITSVGSPTVGESISKSGSTTGVTSGQITSVGQTVNFDLGTVYNEFGTTVYSDHGDSGGSGYDGSVALGTLSGGDTQTTFFYPASLEFSDYGLSLP